MVGEWEEVGVVCPDLVRVDRRVALAGGEERGGVGVVERNQHRRTHVHLRADPSQGREGMCSNPILLIA